MLKKVKRGGSLYLSFPSAKSLSFPSRIGTLNYYDDITHNNEPPDLENIIEILKKNGLIFQKIDSHATYFTVASRIASSC